MHGILHKLSNINIIGFTITKLIDTGSRIVIVIFIGFYELKIMSFLTISRILSLVPGIPGVLFRRYWYCKTIKSCGSDIFIDFGAIIDNPEVIIGKSVRIGQSNIISRAIIGNQVLFSANVSVLSGKNQHSYSLSNVHINKQCGIIRTIEIGNDVWLGNGSIIMSNVGEGSVIGAGSVVVKDIPPFSVAVGNPARVIKSR